MLKTILFFIDQFLSIFSSYFKGFLVYESINRVIIVKFEATNERQWKIHFFL